MVREEQINIGSPRGAKSLLHNRLPLSFEEEGDKKGEVKKEMEVQGSEISEQTFTEAERR